MPHFKNTPLQLRLVAKLFKGELFQFAQDPHQLRVKLLLAIAACASIILGGAWSVYYLWQAKWLLMAFNFSLVILSMLVVTMINAGRDRLAAIFMAHGLALIISVISVFDVPLHGVVRSVHMYYLPIAAGSSLVFRKEGIYLRVIFPLLMLLGCLIFGSSDIGITQASLIANPEIRAVGAWMNNLAALGVLGIALIVMQSDITLRSGLYADMREALAKGHFCLHYQPQVDAQGHIFGAEALLRWQHPEQGLIPPGVFITAAEETGLILPIGNWVLKEACAQLVKWSDHPHLSHLSIAVNVSTSQLRQPDFVQEVQEIVTRSGANPGQIKLELTESMLANEVDDTIQKMRALQAFGMSWSLDDFGTGYSSLNYLKHLPFEQLKIDQSFVRDLLNNESDQAIVDTLVNLGKHLKMTLIAEGVETIEQLEYLHSKGCMKYQGYFFSKPLTVQAFEQLPSPLLSPVAHSTSGLF